MGLTARKITKTSYAYTPSNQIPINRIMCLLNCPSHEVSQLSFPIVELEICIKTQVFNENRKDTKIDGLLILPLDLDSCA
jgi:hypothetical protein